MTFKNIIWKYEPKSDGRCAVKIYTRIKGKVQYFQVEGVYVEEKYWDSKKGKVKKQHPLNQIYNANITKKRNEVELHFLSGGDLSYFKSKKDHISIISLFENYISSCKSGGVDIAKGTIINYESSLKRYKDFITETPFSGLADDINESFASGFIEYMTRKNVTLNTISNHLSRLGTILEQSDQHQNDNFRKFLKVKKTRKGKRHQVYLTRQEIKKIEAVELKNNLDKERDRFLICYYFVLRFGDSTRISRSSIITVDGKKYFHQLSSQKTGVEQMAPLSAKAEEILEKHNYNLNFTTNQLANERIREIAKIAGIDTLIHIDKETAKPKYELINTHSARRSAATNLRLQGASLKTIADLGGWKDIDSLMRYLKASNLDTAKMAQNLDHFK